MQAEAILVMQCLKTGDEKGKKCEIDVGKINRTNIKNKERLI